MMATSCCLGDGTDLIGWSELEFVYFWMNPLVGDWLAEAAAGSRHGLNGWFGWILNSYIAGRHYPY